MHRNAQGEWLLGVNFNQEGIEERLIPDRSLLDRWFAKKPAVIVRCCLHLLAMNSAAMQRLGMYRDNGLFLEADVFAILNRLLPDLPWPPRVIVERGWAQLKAEGYSRVIDMAMDKSKRSLFRKPDYYTTDWDLLNESLGFKIYLDGSLGASTAALFEPYNDDPTNCGRLNYSDSEALQLFDRVHQQGKPVSCHAIGDRAVDQFLRVIMNSRHPQDRLEHLQVANPAQFDELAHLGVAVCIQPCASGELSWARQRLGDRRIQTAYAWNLMRERGLRLLAGTDAPVDTVNPHRGAQLAHSQEGAHHLDYQYTMKLFSQHNWSFYGWDPGSASQVI